MRSARRLWLRSPRWMAPAIAFALLLVSVPAAAQFVSTASIQGTVTDQTGAALPGVTLTITSPALQVPQMTETSNGQGRYLFTQLPAGVYDIRCELSGFQTVVREKLTISPGFAATVDLSMHVGAVEETVTVSGASPVVDLKTTSANTTLTPDIVNKLLPSSRQYGDMARIIPGLQSTSAPNIGRLGLGTSGSFNAYGDSALPTLLIDGFEVRSNTYPDFASAQAVDIKTFGNGADVQSSGSVWNIISKSGGNQFHGRYAEQYINKLFQGDNLDDTLRAQGLGFTDSVDYYSDLNGDLGGRIVPDKLWFYGGVRDRRNKRTVAGLSLEPGADGVFGTVDDSPYHPPVRITNYSLKLQYQPTPKYQFIGFRAIDYQDSNGGGNSSKGANRFIPYESATDEIFDVHNWHTEFRATFKDNLLFNDQFGNAGYTVSYLDTGPDHSNNTIVARWNRNTGEFTGGGVDPTGGNFAEAIRPTSTYTNQGNLTYLPKGVFDGKHELKIGYRLQYNETHTEIPNHPAGNYQLTYDVVPGVAPQCPSTLGTNCSPVEIVVYNAPVTPLNNLNTYSWYVNDKWDVTSRLTANVGVRWDYDHAYLPAQTKSQGPFGNAGSYPAFEGNTFKNFAPRFGVAYSVTGDNKTVIKSTFSVYNSAGPTAQTYNQNAVGSWTYRWHDLNHNNNYDPGEVNLDVNNPTDFLSTTAASNNIFNPNLQRTTQREFSLLFDRELQANMQLRAGYVYKLNLNQTATVNVLRPYSAFNIPLTRRDPGPDGLTGTADDGGTVTIWDYDPAFRGAAFVGNELLNRPSDRNDYFHTIELTLNRRFVGKWGLLSSFTVIKNHRWLTGIPTSPNDDYFPLDETWNPGFKVSGSYRLPYDFGLSGGFDLLPGVKGQRSYVFRAADPLGGPPLRQQTTVTLRLDPFGTERGPVRPLANLRLSKFVKLRTGEIQVALDALNLFNTNTFWSMDFTSGPTYGYGTAFTDPRALQIGVTYEF